MVANDNSTETFCSFLFFFFFNSYEYREVFHMIGGGRYSYFLVKKDMRRKIMSGIGPGMLRGMFRV